MIIEKARQKEITVGNPVFLIDRSIDEFPFQNFSISAKWRGPSENNIIGNQTKLIKFNYWRNIIFQREWYKTSSLKV